MKKIINNKKYDTDTAKCIGSWDNGTMPSDLDYLSESLYKKRTGEYFVHGEGGARSRYASEGEDGWFSGGQAIVPVNLEAAMMWAEEHLSADAYEAEFGEGGEGDGTAMVSCCISAAAKRKLERTAAEHGITQSLALERMIMGE